MESYDDKWLPTPYSSLIRRTPLPQPGTSPAPPAPTGNKVLLLRIKFFSLNNISYKPVQHKIINKHSKIF